MALEIFSEVNVCTDALFMAELLNRYDLHVASAGGGRDSPEKGESSMRPHEEKQSRHVKKVDGDTGGSVVQRSVCKTLSTVYGFVCVVYFAPLSDVKV